MKKFRSDNLATLREAHTTAAIRERLRCGPDQNYLRDFVYGAIDGAVTTFAVVAGVAGAELDTGVIIILGGANLVADGFSMAASNYLGTRAEEQLRHQARITEEQQIADYPEGEREEVREIFRNKGFDGPDLERAVEIITADHKRWVDMMLTEELGLSLVGPLPLRAATATFVAFVVIGIIPLVPFLIKLVNAAYVSEPFYLSVGMTSAAFFAVGSMKSWFVQQKWYWAGGETLLIGGSAATLSFIVGKLLGSLA